MTDSPTRTRWLIVGLIFVTGVLMFIDRVNISIAAKYIMPEYGLTDVQMGSIFSAFVLGYALVQIPGGWLGDRFSPRLVLGTAFLFAAVIGFLMFNGSGAVLPQVILSFGWGIVVSGVIYVNLAGYHVKSLRGTLTNRGSGVFVTSLYGSASVAGYVMGWIATQGGWAAAGTIQLTLLSLIAATLALALRPDQMSV